MVKGLSKRVVVVKPSGHEAFEQAIFIMRDDAFLTDEEGIVKQALETAKRHMGRERSNLISKIPAPVFLLAGVVFTGFIWFISAIR